MTEARQKLADLEQEGRYVFHGSGSDVETFEPRQAFTMIEEKNTPDGEPAVFASPFADYAIFMALINKENCPKGYRASVRSEEGVLIFRATQTTLSQLNEETTGFVYVFEKAKFEKRSDEEWVSYSTVTPISKIQVYLTDFAPEIKIIDLK